ncbi:MAG: hypothetical protein JO050_02700 [Acidimicrobiia bacterium]|nr:hypothetical protein [Acidimicrobiia bacterium]
MAVLVLVFSDQPATQRLRSLGGGGETQMDPASSDRPLVQPPAPPSTARVLQGPPPADVLQRQLALPSMTHRVRAATATGEGPTGAGPTGAAATGGGPSGASPTRERPTPGAETVPDRAYGVRLGPDERVTLLTRVRSSIALLVLLAAVGTTVALAIGAVLFLAGLALRHTLR